MLNLLTGLPLKAYLYAGIIALVLILGFALNIQSSRLKVCKTEFEAFKAQVKAEGEAAEAARQKDIKDRKAISDKQEADHVKRYASLDARYRAAVAAARVSNNPSSSETKPLSSAASVLNCPDRQADIARGLESLEIAVLGFLERGDKAIERTITCKAWLDEQIAKPQ